MGGWIGFRKSYRGTSMTNTAADGRRIFTWRGKPDDTKRLAQAIAEACATELFVMNGGLVMPRDGGLVQISAGILRDLVTKHIAAVKLVHNSDGTWGIEFFSFEFRGGMRDTSVEPDDKVLISLMSELAQLVAKGPVAPSKLTPQHQREVAARLKQGEPAKSIAAAYGVDADEIRQLGTR